MPHVARIAAAFGLLALVASSAAAQEFRRFQAIATPVAAPDGFERVETIDPVSGRAAEDAAKDLIKAWNDPGFSDYIAEDFVDRDRLLDSMVEDVPLDADIRILSMRTPQTLQQFQTRDGDVTRTMSIVSVVADTQIEFQDPQLGFRRLRGENELLLRVTEENR